LAIFGGDPPGLIAREHVSLPGLVLISPEVRAGDGLTGRVRHDERLLKFADGPGGGEATGRRAVGGRTGEPERCELRRHHDPPAAFRITARR
jgi:hypothetical protein